MRKLPVISVLLSSLVFGLLIPMLEINPTHLLNPGWPPHARLHEAWQLITNGAISVFALYLVATSKAPKIAIVLSLIINVSFLSAFVLARSYGGSMLHTDGTQMAVGGINVAVLIVIVVITILLFSLRHGRPEAAHGTT
ncbi:hypothetical protein GCM10007853_21080 [Algimonas ampicilliniresistens]|uniref:DUF4383 domain-containing protein n=1 Tax=Algimonas ampicilliniresistens TaxID=1298735 RepID=A0ABQ5VB68_9PROT|nr:hypothetical protein [Algimonas ampicilliniresistens]GLQ24234.1 hypothetical protein GCM10007853_21080 [Algimonas ampicilliniresistens]